VLCFADADTTHAPDLVGRAVNAMRGLDASLLSVIGRQELGTFWERVAQPHVLAMLAFRYGGTEHVTRSPRRSDKIANGQCLLVTREAYEAVGTHAAVRRAVSEDLVLAQRVFDAGRVVALVTGGPQLATRMYTSLGELVRGWRKNVYAGGPRGDPVRLRGAGRVPAPAARDAARHPRASPARRRRRVRPRERGHRRLDHRGRGPRCSCTGRSATASSTSRRSTHSPTRSARRCCSGSCSARSRAARG
jgi:hypothetical protein